MPAMLFDPPYYALIFTAQRTDGDEAAYARTAALMDQLAAQVPGYLGIESTRDAKTGLGITVSYWRDEAAIQAWKTQADHVMARQAGRDRWYASYALRVAKVEREYDFHKPENDAGWA